MRRWWKWNRIWGGFIVLFFVTATLALVSMYSSCRKGSNAPIFEEPKNANVTIQKGMTDTSYEYQPDSTDSVPE
jgi:hypothetical protein